jgi:hypothetical protein
LKDKAAPATVNRELASLKRMFRLGLRQGMVATMPYIAMLAEHNVRKGFFELDQFQAILKHLPSDDGDGDDWPQDGVDLPALQHRRPGDARNGHVEAGSVAADSEGQPAGCRLDAKTGTLIEVAAWTQSGARNDLS